MLRTRSIRPGIATNETLAALGAEATLMFERLWMLADREGLLEYRPARIRAEAFPYWPDFPVENLVEKLRKSGFVQIYSRGAIRLLRVTNFHRHQKVNPHEARSVLPGPRNHHNKKHLQNDDADACIDMSVQCTPMQRNGALLSSLSNKKESTDTEYYGEGEESEGNHDEPPPPPSAKKPKPPKPKEPGKAQASAPSGERAPTDQREPVNFWPHDERDVQLLRGLLAEIGRPARLPPADDEIIRRVLDAGRGAHAGAIHDMLLARWKRGAFRSIQSWGLIPVVVGGAFRAA